LLLLLSKTFSIKISKYSFLLQKTEFHSSFLLLIENIFHPTKNFFLLFLISLI
jgi:hypothetical protein